MPSYTWTGPDPIAPINTPLSEGESDLFGEDIYFSDDFQETAGGDYVVTTGQETVRQAIYRRLLVRPGEFRVRPEYGVGVSLFVKKGVTQSTIDDLGQRIVEQLTQETRIDRLVEVTVTKVTENSRPGVKIYIKAELQGRTRVFKPFTFVDTP